VIAGIWPLASLRNAEFLVNELHVPVPPEYMQRMNAARSGEAAQAEGVAIARELVQRVRPMAAGVQISTPSGRYQAALDVAQAARS
jgi:homocysteine S-methyltransferase